ncbi:hypothetical protein ACIA98_41535 [Streptomyces sp. NPDC051366]|uniref:hypothetical protein n=1 Tax=Streptomyces sp. NPDC051366 TaxID=3365652 RepID=UPI0037A58146
MRALWPRAAAGRCNAPIDNHCASIPRTTSSPSRTRPSGNCCSAAGIRSGSRLRQGFERTLIGLETDAAKGDHGGRPPAIDGDMLDVTLIRCDATESVAAIAKHLGIGRSPFYGTLAAYDEATSTLENP